MKAKHVGSHVKVRSDGLFAVLKAGIGFYPEEGTDKCFDVQYVEKAIIPAGGYPGEVDDTGQPLDWGAYNLWVESLPTIWELNPAFVHFLLINPNTTLPQLESEIQRVFSPDVVTSADTFLSIRGTREQERRGFSLYRKMMAARERLGDGVALPRGFDAPGLIIAADNKFRGLGGELDGDGRILDISPGTVDIGAPAIDRPDYLTTAYTFIAQDNPANENDQITSVEIWVKSNLSNCEVATFYEVSGSPPLVNFSTRDSETLGNVTSGSKQTFSGLDMTAVTGDLIGYYCSAGEIEATLSGGAGIFRKSGDYVPCSDETFDNEYATAYVMSLYGEGEAEETPINVSDTGAGADSVPSISVAFTLAETGEGAEAIPGMSPTIPAIPDTGAGADVIAAIEAALSLAETGSGVDAVSILYYVTQINVEDVGSGADVINLDITIPAIEDSGVGVDAILGEYTKVVTDRMYSSEYIGIVASMILSELAEGADVIAVQITPIIADTGQALDSVVIAATLAVAEVGSGVDAPSVTVTLTIPETGAGVDSAAAAVSITIADTGQGIEAILRRVLQLARLIITTRSKARMTIKTTHKSRIKLRFRGGSS